MINRLQKMIKNLYLKRLVKRGLTLGESFQMEKGCNIDANFPWLVTIGNNVTLASNVYILTHDGSTKKVIGYSKIGKVNIGNNVFIGTKSIIFPGVNIGDNVVVGANSCVTSDLPSGTVAIGNPARVVMTIEAFTEKNKKRIDNAPVYDIDYTLWGGISIEKKEKMKNELEGKNGFII